MVRARTFSPPSPRAGSTMVWLAHLHVARPCRFSSWTVIGTTVAIGTMSGVEGTGVEALAPTTGVEALAPTTAVEALAPTKLTWVRCGSRAVKVP